MNRLARFDEALRRDHKVSILVGVDEAGRGPLAGPVVAGAVALPSDCAQALEGVRDSKALLPSARETLFWAIRTGALAWAVGWCTSEEVDRHNILRASLIAMRRALARLRVEAPFLTVVDGPHHIPDLPAAQRPIVDGDACSLAVASASIIAKVVRDRWMSVLHRRWPDYGFAENKGYGTPRHLKALDRLGPCPIHRRTFSPVAQAALPLG